LLARSWTSGAAPLGLLFGFFAPTQPFSSSSEIGNESTKYTKPLESVGQVPHTRANFNFHLVIFGQDNKQFLQLEGNSGVFF